MKSAYKKHLQEVLSLSFEKMKKTYKPSSTPEIIFSSSNLEGIIPRHDNSMITSVVMVKVEVKKVFID